MLAYIYKVDKSFCFSSPNFNYKHELHIETVIRLTFNVTENPNLAQFYVLPACPAIYLSRMEWNEKKTRQYDAYLMTTMRAVGNFVELFPRRHLIPRMRCPTLPDLCETDEMLDESRYLTRNKLLSTQLAMYPQIWNRSSLFRFFCFETSSLLRGDDGSVRVDRYRSIHLPYYIDQPWQNPNFGTAKIRFIGSQCCNRSFYLNRLPETNKHLNEHNGRVTTRPFITTHFVREARFMYMPGGDTPERRSIYQSIALGTPVYFTSRVTPPLGLPDWVGWGYTDVNESTALLPPYPDMELGVRRYVFKWYHPLFLMRFKKIVESVVSELRL